MHSEKLLEICFFDRKGFVGQVQEVVVGERINNNQGIVLNPFTDQFFNVFVCLVKGIMRIVW